MVRVEDEVCKLQSRVASFMKRIFVKVKGFLKIISFVNSLLVNFLSIRNVLRFFLLLKCVHLSLDMFRLKINNYQDGHPIS